MITNNPILKPNIPANFSDLPFENGVRIFEYLDPNDLAQCSQTSHFGHQLATDFQVWNSIAKRINCPLDKKKDSRTQVLNFTARIIKQAEAIKDRPSEITAILKRPTIDQINKIQDWLQAREDLLDLTLLAPRIRSEFPALNLNLEVPGEIGNLTVQEVLARATSYREWRAEHAEAHKARDTLVVWKRMAISAGLQFPDFEIIDTEQDLIARAGEFAAWWNANQPVLAGATNLFLSDMLLTFLPREISQLNQLRQLDLSGNLFSAAPSEIGQLTQLEFLDLSQNRFTELPQVIRSLTALQRLILTDTRITELPDWINELNQIVEIRLEKRKWIIDGLLSDNRLMTIGIFAAVIQESIPYLPTPLSFLDPLISQNFGRVVLLATVADSLVKNLFSYIYQEDCVIPGNLSHRRLALCGTLGALLLYTGYQMGTIIEASATAADFVWNNPIIKTHPIVTIGYAAFTSYAEHRSSPLSEFIWRSSVSCFLFGGIPIDDLTQTMKMLGRRILPLQAAKLLDFPTAAVQNIFYTKAGLKMGQILISAPQFLNSLAARTVEYYNYYNNITQY